MITEEEIQSLIRQAIKLNAEEIKVIIPDKFYEWTLEIIVRKNENK